MPSISLSLHNGSPWTCTGCLADASLRSKGWEIFKKDRIWAVPLLLDPSLPLLQPLSQPSFLPLPAHPHNLPNRHGSAFPCNCSCSCGQIKEVMASPLASSSLHYCSSKGKGATPPSPLSFERGSVGGSGGQFMLCLKWLYFAFLSTILTFTGAGRSLYCIVLYCIQHKVCIVSSTRWLEHNSEFKGIFFPLPHFHPSHPYGWFRSVLLPILEFASQPLMPYLKLMKFFSLFKRYLLHGRLLI